MTPFTYWKDGDIVHTDRSDNTDIDMGLHYGLGVFEGIRVYETSSGPSIFRLDEHMDRMRRGADWLDLPLDLDAMVDGMHRLLADSGMSSAYIRPIAWVGGGTLHLRLNDMRPRQVVLVLPWTSHLGDDTDKGIKMTLARMRRNSHEAIPTFKLSGGYVNAAITKHEAMRRGFDTAAYTDPDGFVVEATAENLFLVHGDKLIAVDHPDALPGITRQTLVELSGAELRKVTLEELRQADEIFVAGTSAEVTPVTLFEDRILPVGRVTRALRDTYQDVVHGRDLGYEHWLHRCVRPLALAGK
jgi:branched-chain amino acid aminotransferase